MTIQFVGGLLIGMALTFFGISSVSIYLSHKEMDKSDMIIDLMKERDKYKKFYLEYRDRVDSGY